MAEISGGMDPLSIVFGLAALTATVIKTIEANPETYTPIYDFFPDFPTQIDQVRYYEALPAGMQ